MTSSSPSREPDDETGENDGATLPHWAPLTGAAARRFERAAARTARPFTHPRWAEDGAYDTWRDFERNTLLAAATAFQEQKAAVAGEETGARSSAPPPRRRAPAKDDEPTTSVYPADESAAKPKKGRTKKERQESAPATMTPPRVDPVSWTAICGGTFLLVLLAGLVVLGSWVGG